MTEPILNPKSGSFKADSVYFIEVQVNEVGKIRVTVGEGTDDASPEVFNGALDQFEAIFGDDVGVYVSGPNFPAADVELSDICLDRG